MTDKDNVDRTFMQRRTVKEVERIFADMSANAKRDGRPDPVVTFTHEQPNTIMGPITYSYEQMDVPSDVKQKEYDILCAAIFGELFGTPKRPAPRLVTTNDAPTETDKPKATLTLVSEKEFNKLRINLDF